MTFFLFILFSTLEYFSSLTLMLVLFRFSWKEHYLKFLVFSILLSLISNTLIQQGLDSIAPLVQLLVFMFLVYVVLRVNLINSMIMVFTTYFIFGLVQITIIMMFTYFGIIENVAVYEFSAFITQVASSFYMFLFAAIIYWRHGGFSFVDYKSNNKKLLLFNKANRIFFIVLIVVFVLFVSINMLYYNSSRPPYLLIALIFLFSLFALLYLAIRRDDGRV
ncbi:hypothetical protein ACF3MZ_01910 [Paenibacillaceae bacterium WGS1546]|uniref:hypothetical protein n=1 Tax=Cohnella sp. WGS1546 TaxID=3366810 RepID=UPI00372D3238